MPAKEAVTPIDPRDTGVKSSDSDIIANSCPHEKTNIDSKKNVIILYLQPYGHSKISQMKHKSSNMRAYLGNQVHKMTRLK